MFKEQDFDDIRPYYDEEINTALKRIVAVAEFKKILEFLFPDKNQDQIIHNLEQIRSALEFQKQFMHPLVNSIVKKTSKGLSTSGFDILPKDKPCLFVGNHRDIVLDSAILQVILLDYGHETSEITFGSNLMTNQFIIDLGKVNRMFKVNRGGNRMELFRNSQLLSAYIRHTLVNKHTSAWIAQRSGRTKDGNDRTETGLLKMFHISGSCDFQESISALNIVPLSISYEYEPCCAFKVRELQSVSRGIPYQKEPNEDFMSILAGITQQKGHIHLSACQPVNQLLQEIPDAVGQNEKINKLASLMDAGIYANYKLWPTNYIAFDLLHGVKTYTEKYSDQEVKEFQAYSEKELSAFRSNERMAREMLLKIYANPVQNARSQE
jgi:hypothetical protein